EGNIVELSLQGNVFNATVQWTEEGGMNLNSTTVLNPIFSNTALPGVYPIRVDVTDVMNGCVGFAEQVITVFGVERPVPTDKIWMIGNIANIPNDFMEATLTSGSTINWYGDPSRTNMLSMASNTYTPDRVALQAEYDA